MLETMQADPLGNYNSAENPAQQIPLGRLTMMQDEQPPTKHHG